MTLLVIAVIVIVCISLCQAGNAAEREKQYRDRTRTNIPLQLELEKRWANYLEEELTKKNPCFGELWDAIEDLFHKHKLVLHSGFTNGKKSEFDNYEEKKRAGIAREIYIPRAGLKKFWDCFDLKKQSKYREMFINHTNGTLDKLKNQLTGDEYLYWFEYDKAHTLVKKYMENDWDYFSEYKEYQFESLCNTCYKYDLTLLPSIPDEFFHVKLLSETHIKPYLNAGAEYKNIPIEHLEETMKKNQIPINGGAYYYLFCHKKNFTFLSLMKSPYGIWTSLDDHGRLIKNFIREATIKELYENGYSYSYDKKPRDWEQREEAQKTLEQIDEDYSYSKADTSQFYPYDYKKKK